MKATVWCSFAMGLVMAVGLTAAAQATDPAQPQPADATTLSDFKRWVIAADYSRDGSLLITAGGDSLLYRPGDVVVWQVSDGRRVGDLAGHPTAVWAVKVSADGKVAATAGYDGLIKIWNLQTRTLKHDLRKHKSWVRSLAFSPDGTRLASAGEDGTVVFWDTNTGAEVKAVPAHTGAVTAVAFSPDGSTLATGGSDKLVKLWNAADGAEKGKLAGHDDAIRALAYSPDGSRLATASDDRTIRLWTTSDLSGYAVLSGHKNWITSVAFSADSGRLVSGSLDGALKLWDVNAKGEQEGPAKLASSVWTVAFTPDGKLIFAGTHAGPQTVAAPAPKLLPPPPPAEPKPAAPPAAVPSTAASVNLVPTEFSSAAGASGAIAADGTVIVTGNLAKDTYSLKAVLPPGVEPVAFRLQALPDDSLPSKGPGRAANGNFVLSQFRVAYGNPGATDAPTAVKFSGAKASFEQGGFIATQAIDEDPATGWAIHGGIGTEQVVTFEIAPDVKVAPGAPLTISIDQQHADGQHAIGKFRISIVPVAK